MATIIETPRGFIAGDPPAVLPADHHWCESCGGDGLAYDDFDELTVCGWCFGSCVAECIDDSCPDHPKSADSKTGEH